MSDITREKFEAWFTKRYFVTTEEGSHVKEMAYVVWEASRIDFIKELLGMDVEPVAHIANGDLALLKRGMHPISGAKTAKDDIQLLTTTQAAAMVLQEREKCANVCDDLKSYDYCVDVRQAASAIRNRKD